MANKSITAFKTGADQFKQSADTQRAVYAELIEDALATIGPGVEKFRYLAAQMGPDSVGYNEINNLLRQMDTGLVPKLGTIVKAAKADTEAGTEGETVTGT